MYGACAIYRFFNCHKNGPQISVDPNPDRFNDAAKQNPETEIDETCSYGLCNLFATKPSKFNARCPLFNC